MPPKKQQAETSQQREPSQPKKANKKEPHEESKTEKQPKSPIAKKRMPSEPKQVKSAKKPIKEDKLEESKNDAKPSKSQKSALPPKDLGPEPKKPKSSYNFFNTAYCAQLKEGNADLKQSDCFKLAGEKWSSLTDDEKLKYTEMAEKDKALHETRIKQREKHGFFTFADGTKSTDTENKDKVKKEQKSKPKVGEQETDEDDQVLQPPRVLSAYTLFMKSFQPPEGTANLDRMKVAGAHWNAMDPEDKKKYDQLRKDDEHRHDQQLAEMKKKGWFTMEDGTKSSDHKPKKKRVKVAKRDVSGDDDEDEQQPKAKPERKIVVESNKPKQQLKKQELHVESSEISEDSPVKVAAVAKESVKIIKPKANGGKKQNKIETE